VGKGKCGRADAISGCRKSCGHCGGCPSSRSPPPPGINGAGFCAFPTQVYSYALITKGDAWLASHSHYKGIAIGGTLTDTTPLQHGTVSAKSFVTGLSSQTASTFIFADGVTPGQPLPMDWTRFQLLARTLRPSPSVFIVDQGGDYNPEGPRTGYSMDTFCNPTNANLQANVCQSGATGQNMLVVFKGKGTVALQGSVQYRQWQPTVLAPFAHVVAESSTNYVDGVVIAKSFESAPNMDQMHAYLYMGPLLCDESSSPGTSCTDQKSQSFCQTKLAKGKCDKKGIRTKCPATCSVCPTV
jgi:hypothetical protein